MEYGICRLCQVEKPLIKRSHVIPKFVYKKTFGNIGNFFIANYDEKQILSSAHGGIYDQYFYCSQCDNEIFSSYERYACNLLFNDSINPTDIEVVAGEDGLRQAYIRNIDFNRLKLYYLSLLYRAHKSKHSFFSNVDLGEKHSANIQKDLLSGMSEPERYKVNVSLPMRSILPQGFFGPPRKIKNGHNTFYAMLIGNQLVFYNVSEKDPISIFNHGYIGDEYMIIAMLEGELGSSFLQAYLRPSGK